MRVYAFAAFLALAIFGITSNAAKADYYCCGRQDNGYDFITERFYVVKEATIFGCDGYHCETNVRLRSDIHIKARCRNGWCEIRSLNLKNAWVLEICLQRTGYGRHGAHGDGYDESSVYNENIENNHLDGSSEDENGEQDK